MNFGHDIGVHSSWVKTPDEVRKEAAAAAQLGAAWKVELHSFGRWAAIDWYAVREDQLVGVCELKCREVEHDAYPTVFLNVRKWLSLLWAAEGLNVPSAFVVRFTDGIYWVPVTLHMGGARIAGRAWRPGAQHDREPVIDVPVSALRFVNAVLEPRHAETLGQLP